MSEILLMCLMVLVVISNTSGHWTKKSEEDPKDLKNEKENMKELFAHWQENNQNKRFTTTTSTSTMPPTTSTTTTKILQTTKDPKFIELMKRIEEMEDEMKERNKEIGKEREEELERIKQDNTKKFINLCTFIGSKLTHKLTYEFCKCTIPLIIETKSESKVKGIAKTLGETKCLVYIPAIIGTAIGQMGPTQKGPAKRDRPKGAKTQKGPWPKGAKTKKGPWSKETMAKRDQAQKGPWLKGAKPQNGP